LLQGRVIFPFFPVVLFRNVLWISFFFSSWQSLHSTEIRNHHLPQHPCPRFNVLLGAFNISGKQFSAAFPVLPIPSLRTRFTLDWEILPFPPVYSHLSFSMGPLPDLLF